MIELLQSVLASEGLYHLAGHNDYEPIKRKIKFFDSLDDAESICNSFLDEDRNVYFALGTFKDEKAKKRADNLFTELQKGNPDEDRI